MSETSSAAQTAPKLEFIGVIHEGIPVEPDKLEACIAAAIVPDD